MALAVAMVACSAAAGKPGPAGPSGEQGPKGDTGEPATTPEPGETPGATGPVQIVKGIGALVFNNVEMNGKTEVDTMAKTVMLADHFFPAGLTYTLEGHSMAEMKRFTAVIEADTLTVQLKKDTPYKDDKITVKATGDDSSESVDVAVRRNRKPSVVDPTYVTDGSNLDPAANKQAVPVVVWVGTVDEVTVMAKDVGDSSYDASKHIGVAIASSPDILDISSTPNVDRRAFFNDDVGDTLTLMHETLSASDSRKLMVTDGSIEVTLLGIKTTKTASEGIADDITVDFVAEDSGKLKSVASVPVLKVNVDALPTKVAGATPIPTQLVTIGTVKNVMVTAATNAISADDLRAMFEDDWHLNTANPTVGTDDHLIISAKSDNPDIVLVQNNLENKGDIGIATDGLVIIGLKEGSGSITVTAKESADADMSGSANLQQSVNMTFNVTVKAPPPSG